MWFRLKAYGKFLFRSNNQHGVHSPFVYALVTRCFYARKQHSAYEKIKRFRHFWFARQKSTAPRKPDKSTCLSLKKSKLLNRLVRYLKIDSALVVSSCPALAASAISAGNTVEIFSLEKNRECAIRAKKALVKNGFHSVETLHGNLASAIKKIPVEKIDLAYVDTLENDQSIAAIFEALVPLSSERSVFIFSGIHQSKTAESAWKNLQENPMVTVTIDTFFWGLVFFKNDQAEQHFKIRA